MEQEGIDLQLKPDKNMYFGPLLGYMTPSVINWNPEVGVADNIPEQGSILALALRAGAAIQNGTEGPVDRLIASAFPFYAALGWALSSSGVEFIESPVVGTTENNPE